MFLVDLTILLYEIMNTQKINKLKQFITEQGKIIPKRMTVLNSKEHRQVTRHIKQARILGFVPFVLTK